MLHRTGALIVQLACAVAIAAAAGCSGASEESAAPSDELPLVRLAATGSEPALVAIGGDSRFGLRVGAGESVEIVVEEPRGGLRAGDRLVLDAALASSVDGTEARIEVGAAEGATSAAKVGASWRTLRFDVDPTATTWDPTATTWDPTATTWRVRAGERDLVVAAPRVVRDADRPPTVVLITSDTHRGDHVSAARPSSPVSTPHIDALAREGVLFTDCLSTTNITCPSHIALMTGVHPRDSKITDNQTRMRGVAETLAERFREQGYQTFAAVSVFALRDDNSGLGQGFDRIDVPHGAGVAASVRDGEETLEIARRWLDDARGAPLFLWVHLFDAHAPYEVPDARREKIASGRPDPFRSDATLGVPADRVPSWIARTGIRDGDFIDALYAGEVEYLDGALGPFLAEERIADAVIAFTSDHGEALGERGKRWDHAGLQLATLDVPLVLRGPGAEGGLRVDGPVRQFDVGRTLLDMSGVADAPFPGRDLRASIDEPPAVEPRFALSASALSAAVEHEGWVLELHLRNADVAESGTNYRVGRCTLFDTRSDPECRDDRLVDEFDRAKRLRASLIAWLERAQVTGMNAINDEISPEVTARLAELGYSGGYEELVKWWSPEQFVEGWETDPWNVAFEDDGDPTLLEDALREWTAR